MNRFRGAVEFSIYSHMWPFTAATLEVHSDKLHIERLIGADVTLARGEARVEMIRSGNPFVVGRALKVQTGEKRFYFVPWRPSQLAKALATNGWIHSVQDASSNGKTVRRQEHHLCYFGDHFSELRANAGVLESLNCGLHPKPERPRARRRACSSPP